MELEEAIEILKTFHDHAACFFDAISAAAFQLGIEAMQRDEKNRLIDNHPDQALLPSEMRE